MISRIVDVKRRTEWGGFVDMSSGLRRNCVCVCEVSLEGVN
jgi:hypothetical protein